MNDIPTGMEDCRDLIISMYVEKGMTISDIAEELRRMGYDVKGRQVAKFLRNIKLDGKEISKLYIDTLYELFDMTERLKELLNLFEISDENDAIKKYRPVIEVSRQISDLLTQIAKHSGQMTTQSMNIEKQEINVYQFNQALHATLVKFADEGKIKILDKELMDLYENLKRKAYDGYGATAEPNPA